MAYTTINKSTDYFNPVAYAGNGASDRAVTSGFATDFVWIKNRNTTDDHVIFDKVRGGTKYIYTNATQAESTYSGLDLTFENTGVDVGSYTTINNNGSNLISYHLKANGQGSSNTAGSINTTYTSANTTSGFSIVKWTSTDTAGSTIGHGLGAVPKMIITKKLTGGNPNYWTTYHNSIGNTKSIFLNDAGAASGASTSYWNDTSPTSSVFSTGTYLDAGDYIAYCFAEKQGFSKFGSYTGNGNANGTFVYTGFKPAFVMIKQTTNTDSASNWFIMDNKRNEFNVVDKLLYASNSNAEGTSGYIDINSNGFKLRKTSTGVNASGSTYIYMAFAEAPLVGTNNVPCTAR